MKWHLFISLPLMNQSFPKSQKLKSRKVITQLFNEGKGLTKYPIKVLYLPTDKAPDTKAGFTAPKRSFKLAVTRNRLKRLMRESYRTQKAETLEKNGTTFVLLFIYIGKEVADFKLVKKSFIVLLKKLCDAKV
ncbi:ribonuclease P protein component [Patiriisocius sp. Uisw_017]|jgi:ribonuclease P protein component|uniref:ribonuclease P protein component n=1 Tax=Patiriisocius sp. Uisw_017 TaxID=3230968 RepID=UPI0039ECFA05